MDICDNPKIRAILERGPNPEKQKIVDADKALQELCREIEAAIQAELFTKGMTEKVFVEPHGYYGCKPSSINFGIRIPGADPQKQAFLDRLGAQNTKHGTFGAIRATYGCEPGEYDEGIGALTVEDLINGVNAAIETPEARIDMGRYKGRI